MRRFIVPTSPAVFTGAPLPRASYPHPSSGARAKGEGARMRRPGGRGEEGPNVVTLRDDHATRRDKAEGKP